MKDRWLHWLAGMALAGMVAYFTTTSAIQSEIAVVKATQQSNFEEILRRLDAMVVDIREIRSDR